MPRAGHGLGLLASCQALSSLAWTLNFRLEPKPGSRECKIYSVIDCTDCLWNVRDAWSHREDTSPTSLGRRPSYTARRKEAVKSHQRLRVLHISLDPGTWEPLSTESSYSSISVPLSQLCWALASDIGSYPPYQDHQPFFTHHKTWHSLKGWYVLPMQTWAGPEPMAGGRSWKFPCLLFCCYSLLHIWDLFFYRFKSYIENKLVTKMFYWTIHNEDKSRLHWGRHQQPTLIALVFGISWMKILSAFWTI